MSPRRHQKFWAPQIIITVPAPSVTMLGMQSLIPLVLEVERKSKFQEHGEALADLVHSLNCELRVVCEVLQADAREATTRSSSRRLRRA